MNIFEFYLFLIPVFKKMNNAIKNKNSFNIKSPNIKDFESTNENMTLDLNSDKPNIN